MRKYFTGLFFIGLLYFLSTLPLVMAEASKDIVLEAQRFSGAQKQALVIGISQYNTRLTGLNRLKYADKDALQLRTTLAKKHYRVTHLVNHQATKNIILSRIEELGKTFDSRTGTFVFSFSGHGFSVNGKAYLATADAIASSPKKLAQTGLSVDQVVQAIRRTGVRRAMLFIDACRNNPVEGQKGLVGGGFTRLNPGKGIRILYSTRKNNLSWESAKLGKGVFTYFLNKALTKNYSANGIVLFNDVAREVEYQVKAWTSQNLSTTQQPYRGNKVESFGDFVVSSPSNLRVKKNKPAYRPPPQQIATQRPSSAVAAIRKQPQLVTHYHGQKKHQHAFPKVGISHRHGQGMQGSRGVIETEVFTPITTQTDSVYEIKQQESQKIERVRLANNNSSNNRDLKGLNFGRYYALVIGNSHYANFDNIPTAVNDVDAVASVLRSQYGFKTTVLKNASQRRMYSAFNSVIKRMGSTDNLLIYYAGHGQLMGGGHWLPSDADKSNKKTWISNVQLTNFIDATKAKHVLVVADSCYSGTLSQSSIPRPILNSKRNRAWFDAVLTTKVRVVMSSGGIKPVLDSGNGNHSVFANAFLGALRSGNSVMEGAGLYQALRQQVKTASSAQGNRQNPVYAPIKFAGHQAGDFIFLKGGRIH